MKHLFRGLLLALGVTAAAHLIEGIHYDDRGSLLLVVAIITVGNLFLRPLLILLTLPFVILTAGLGVFLINALIFYFASHLVPGFHVTGFWAALGGSLIVSLVSFLVNVLLAGLLGTVRVSVRGSGAAPLPPRHRRRDDDVIDI